MKKITLVLVLLFCIVLLSGCMAGTGEADAQHPAGLLMGIWHGWIAPFVLIFRFFGTDAKIYEFYNTGIWYDVGFYMAIISGFGTLALRRRKKR